MTHNQYIAFFRSFAVNHFQINSFSNGKKQEYTANQTDTTPTTTMWAVVGDTDIDGGVRRSKYSFLFADIINKDKSNLDEVLSDTKRIAEDFLSVIKHPQYEANFMIKGSTSLQSFQDELFDNECAGWDVTITFESDFTEDVCQIPSLGLPNSIGGYTLIINQEGVIIQQVPDGGTYIVTTLTGIKDDPINGNTLTVIDKIL